MDRVSIDDVESDDEGESTRRRLSDHLGTTNLAINHYRIAPGAGLPAGLHAHADQEEVFLVVEGEATFETMDGDVDVGEGEVIRFAPGEFQSGRNAGDRELVVMALGAPRDSGDVRIPVACPECDWEDLRLDFAGEGLTFVCLDCGAERVPSDCPECGGPDLHTTLGDDGDPVVVCSTCEATFDRPPVEGDWRP